MPDVWRVLAEIREVADETGATPAQVAIRWVMDVPGPTSILIIGATSVDQLDETLKAADISLADEQHQRIVTAGEIPDLDPHAYIYT